MTAGWLATEVRPGLAATVQLSRLKARTRSPKARVKTRMEAGLFAVLLLGAALLGDLARRVASGGGTGPLDHMARGSLGGGGAAALASVLAAMVVAPVTGAANQAQFPDLDLAGIRPSRLYRYFDGVWNTVVSPVGASQLITLTGLASLMTSAGQGRLAAVSLAWVTWVSLLPVTALSGWVIEYARRRWTPKIRWWLAGAVALVAGAGVLVDPRHGRTVFGLTDAYGSVVARAAYGHPGPAVGTTLLLLVAGAGCTVVGMAVCRRALVLPVPSERNEQSVRPVRVPHRPSAAVATVILTSLWRAREVRRPILMMLFVAMPLLIGGIRYTGGQGTSVLASVTMVVPLALSLGWGVNVFGVLGGAVTLLLSQPNAWRPLLRQAAMLQLAATVGMGGVLLVTGAATGGAWSALPAYATGLVVAAVVCTLTSVHYSVHRPHRTRLTGRGDPLVPPVVGMEYMVRLMLTGATLGVLVASLGVLLPTWFLMATLVAVAVYGWLRWRRLWRTWSDPHRRAAVAAVVGAV